jgi:dTDP-4-amino-4,6-dideoxygalactose transaminase
MEFIDLKAQYRDLKERIDSRIHRVLEHGKYIMGPEVSDLEEQLARFVGVKHVITCANGTDALTLALMALGIKAGDAVFCPTFTYFASAEAISFIGATPIFVDSDPTTYNICITDLERKVREVLGKDEIKIKAILAVDLFGLPANYPEIEGIAKKYQLKVIEDAAQGFGGDINGKRAGSFGDIATTSFFPAKPLGCYGDGGALFTNNDDYAERLASLRIHGMGADKYDNVRIGMNSRLDTIQAAILLEKLAQFPKELLVRNEVANGYSLALQGKFKLPVVPRGYRSSWAQYTVQSDQREHWIKRLNNSGIPTAIYYLRGMHQQTAFKSSRIDHPTLKVAERLSQTAFSLPMHPYLTSSDIDRISEIV